MIQYLIRFKMKKRYSLNTGQLSSEGGKNNVLKEAGGRYVPSRCFCTFPHTCNLSCHVDSFANSVF